MTKNQRARYPRNWPALARRCKMRAGFACAHCGVKANDLRISRKGRVYSVHLAACHKHHDPENPSPELLCLCERCHGKMDHAHREREARIRLEQLKHLQLLIQAGIVEMRGSAQSSSLESMMR